MKKISYIQLKPLAAQEFGNDQVAVDLYCPSLEPIPLFKSYYSSFIVHLSFEFQYFLYSSIKKSLDQ